MNRRKIGLDRFSSQVFLACLLTSRSLPAAQYEVDGTIEQTVTRPIKVGLGGTNNILDVRPTTYADFTVFVNDCAWLVQTRPKGRTNVLSEIASTNGTEIFQVSFGAVRGSNGVIRRASMAQVYSNGAPVDFNDEGVVGHLWLMYASACHLQAITNHMLTPVWDMTATPMGKPDLKYEAYWELINGPGSTPQSVIYLHPPPYRSAG